MVFAAALPAVVQKQKMNNLNSTKMRQQNKKPYTKYYKLLKLYVLIQ